MYTLIRIGILVWHWLFSSFNIHQMASFFCLFIHHLRVRVTIFSFLMPSLTNLAPYSTWHIIRYQVDEVSSLSSCQLFWLFKQGSHLQAVQRTHSFYWQPCVRPNRAALRPRGQRKQSGLDWTKIYLTTDAVGTLKVIIPSSVVWKRQLAAALDTQTHTQRQQQAPGVLEKVLWAGMWLCVVVLCLQVFLSSGVSN